MNKQASEIKLMSDWLLDRKLMILKCFESNVLTSSDVLINSEILVEMLSHIIADW